MGKRRGAVPAIYDAREFTEDGAIGCGPTLLLQIFWRSLCGADFQGREAERSSGHAFRQVRVCDQSKNRRTARVRSSDALNGEVSGAESQNRCLQG